MAGSFSKSWKRCNGRALSGQRYFVLFNPASGRGRGAQRKDRYLRLLADALGDFDHATSSQPGDLETLTRQALAEDYDCIVAVGGDGTWSLVANEIIDSGRRDVSLGLLPAGTGSDFGKSLGIYYQRVDEAVLALRSDEPRLVDVGKVNGRHFLNAFACGFDIAVIDDAAGFTRLKGGLLYQYCALRQLFRYPGTRVSITADDARAADGRHLMVLVANGRYFGGRFDMAPESDLSDGFLDLVAIDDAGPVGRAQIFSRVKAGKHRDGELVTMRSARSIRIELESPVRYEMDGEIYHSGGNTIEIECVPAALRVHSVL